jgi:hypothetical protein
MSTDTTIAPDAAVVRAGFEAFANGDVAGFADMFHPDATWNHRNDDRLGGVHHGSDGIMAFIAEAAQLSGGTLRPAPESLMSDGRGNVAMHVRVTATRPDGRSHDDSQILYLQVDDGRVRSVDQFVGDPKAVAAFWA